MHCGVNSLSGSMNGFSGWSAPPLKACAAAGDASFGFLHSAWLEGNAFYVTAFAMA